MDWEIPGLLVVAETLDYLELLELWEEAGCGCNQKGWRSWRSRIHWAERTPGTTGQPGVPGPDGIPGLAAGTGVHGTLGATGQPGAIGRQGIKGRVGEVGIPSPGVSHLNTMYVEL